MKQFSNQSGDVVVLKRGEELHAVLQAYAKEHDLKSAWLTGLGGSGQMALGYYNLKSQSYEWRGFSDEHEILNLTGNLSIVDDEPFWHIHGTFGGDDFRAIGGHVRELVVGLTCELHITRLDTPMTRMYDKETGLKLLCPVDQTA